MFRSKLFYWASKIIFGVLCLSLWQCVSDEVRPTITLRKGLRVSDAALETVSVNPFPIINASNNWDSLITLKIKSNDIRPLDKIGYSSYIPNLKKFRISVPQNNIYSINGSGFTFIWANLKDVDPKGMIVAIFRENIEVSWLRNEILNQEDIIWIGKNFKGPNSINFTEGKMVEYDKHTGKLVERSAPPIIEDLKPGIYVWCVWAYDEKGLKIIASSREIPFSISN